jgi:nucleolar GTP-binding protein
MDGKNVFDYVDPEILQKLERLEEEEEQIRNNMDAEEELNSDEESSELSEDLLEAHDELVENKKAIKRKHQMVVGNQLPRKVRDLTASEKFMEQIRTDKQEGLAELKSLSQKKRRETKDRLKRNLINETKGMDEEDEEDNDDMMDIDMEDADDMKPKKKKRMEVNSEEAKLKEKLERQKQQVVERMKRKIQKKWNNESRVNEADRQIGSALPKHLNTGKRGIGKTQRR